jgi:integral membrane protein (TIGR00529 family)
MTIPIIIKLLSSLAVIIILNKLLKRLPAAMFGGTLFFAFWVGMDVQYILTIIVSSLFNLNTAGVLLLVSLVIVLSVQMSKTHMVDRLVSSIRSRFSPKASLGVIPAVIGLLPMPGGALFSAPLLDNFDDLEGINPQTKTSINYWFRHIWEYAWPLYPGIILACDIAGIELWQMLIFGLPMSASAVLFGTLYFLRPVKSGDLHNKQDHTFSLTPFVPVASVIVLYALIQVLAPAVGDINQYLPMVLALLTAIFMLQRMKPMPASDWFDIVRSRKLGTMVVIILMVRIYGSFIEAELNGAPIVSTMAIQMQQFGIPTLPLIIALPFLTGMTMGVSLGFVGASLPVIIALLGPDPSFSLVISTLVFSYVTGFMGTMLSPLHVCMIVTSEYYKTDLMKSYRPIVLPAVSMILIAFAYMQVLQLLL